MPESMRYGPFLAHTALALMLAGGLASNARAADPSMFGDKTIALSWQTRGAHLGDLMVTDAANNISTPVTSPFNLTLSDGKTLGLDQFELDAPPSTATVAGDPHASRASDTRARHSLTFELSDPDKRFHVTWRLIQPEDAPYLREELTVTALKQDEAVTRVDLFQANGLDAEVVGNTNGSPIVAGRDYWLFEDPLSQSTVNLRHGRFQMWVDRVLPLPKGQPITYSAVVGVTAPGQLRRDFLAYVEAERAHPYRTFLHYNSWYDIGYFTPYTETEALDRIHAFGEALSVKRGVKLDSFLFDDGWDDRTGGWGFSKGFPRGFLPLRDAAEKYGAAPGVWLSPWGGYGEPKAQRVAAGRGHGYEIIDGGFALSGPKYYADFHAAALGLLKDQGVNQFKFDGTGNADKVVPGSRFDSDFSAALSLIGDLRQAKPDLFVNLTTGTYPSPAWLRVADSIWRGGEDHDFTGVGTPRERWITYRDRETYQNVVTQGPLYPLNALMLHGLVYAQHAENLNTDPGHDFANEVRSYFGSGTALQEMYITPSLLSDDDWNVLAEAARWSRANADVLKDTHWIGGNPGRLDVYGWAAWAPRKGIITLRNPDARPRSFILDVRDAFELPAGAARRFHVSTPWKRAGSPPLARTDAGRAVTITLKPFEVLTLEFTPKT